MKKVNIRRSILSIVCLIGIYFLWRETSWNFTFLGCVALLLVFGGIKLWPYYLIQNRSKNGKLGSFYQCYGLNQEMDQVSPVKDPYMAGYATCLILIFTFLTFYTLQNYFYADEEVYTNNEHHALRVDGIQIMNPESFVLVKNDSTAFFDGDTFHGDVTIEVIDTTGVTLALNGFTHPIYKQTGVKDSLLTPISSSLSFSNVDTLIFENREGKKVAFYIKEHNFAKSLFPEKDSVDYFFRLQGEDWQHSLVTTLFLQGYELNGLLDGIDIDEFDFNGISIVRAYSNPRAKQYERADCTCKNTSPTCNIHHTRYILELKNEAYEEGLNKISRVTIGNQTIDLSDVAYFSGSVKVNYGQNILFGYGENKTQPFCFELDTISNSPKLNLKFKMPIYRQLYSVKERTENSLYITNSLVKDMKSESGLGIDTNIPDNVLLFDFFNYSDNIHMFKPFNLYFTAGKTTERMTFLCEVDTVEEKYKAGDNLEGIQSQNKNVEWIFCIENLRETTPYSAETMLWVVWSVALASILLINFHYWGCNRYNYHRNTFSYVEFVAYIGIIYLVAFRCFLLWRTTVFRPLENVTKFELDNIIYSTGHFVSLLCCLGGFFILIAFFKYALLHSIKFERYNIDILWRDPIYKKLYNLFIRNINSISRKGIIFTFVGFYTLLIIIIIIFSFTENSRFALLFAILAYFIVDIIINIRCKQPTFDLKDEINRVDAVSSLIYSSINMAITAGIIVLVIRDTGFLIMFGVFCLLAFCFKIQDLYTKIYKKSSGKILLLYVVFFSILLLFLLFCKEIVIKAIELSAFGFILSVFLVGLLLFIGKFAGILKFSIRFPFLIWNGKPIRVIWYITLLFMIAGIGLWGSGFTLSDYFSEHSKHTYQRISVQLNEPHEALAKTQTQGEEMRFLQASHNHFIIEQYYEKSKDIDLFGKGGDGFFKIQPQSKLGAMWNAQLTDIVILRYVISEHAKVLPLLFLGLFLAMLYYGWRKTSYFRFTRSLLIQIPMLLLVQGWLIWLANTQRFIFFGQDFPLLSITSKIMILYVFMLLLIWLSAAIIESVMYRALWEYDKNSKDDVYKNLKTFNKAHALIITVGLTFILIISSFVEEPTIHNKKGRYDMNALLGKKGTVNDYIAEIDTLFKKYQLNIGKEKLALKSNMHSQIVAFNKSQYGILIDSVLKAKALDPKVGDSTAYQFPLRIWKNYVSRGSYHNDYDGLIHVHKEDSLLHIATRSNYYDWALPNHNNDEWKGNIVETYIPKDLNDTIIRRKNFVYYQLPQSWIKEGQSPHLIKRIGEENINTFALNSNQKTELSKNGLNSVLVLHNNDYVYEGKEQINSLPMEKRKYWARNVLVNGCQYFIYPQGESMYWIKDFAKVVEDKKEKDIKNLSHDDVAITLDRKLTNSLYEELKKSSQKNGNNRNSKNIDIVSRSVIVADGNGHIRAMADYKINHEVNPNDIQQIERLNEELYMNPKGNRYKEESYYFQNQNLKRMIGGPGSTQKPLVWTAVASSVDFDWKDLVLQKINEDKLDKDKGGDRALFKYNGERIKGIKLKKSDESLDGNYIDMDLTHYLARSSNYYNALMVYLGLHDKELYDKNRGFINSISNKDYDSLHVFRTIEKHPSQMSKKDYQEQYPFIRIGKNNKIALSRNLRQELFNKSVLYYQFIKSWGLKENSKKKCDSNHLYPDYLSDPIIKNKNSFIVPESSILSFDRFMDKKDFVNVNNPVRSIALGGQDAWDVTPLTMTEMFGKMVTLNSAYKLSFDPNFRNTLIPFGTTNKKYLEARPMMFNGMSLFFTIGTGKELNKNNQNKNSSVINIDINDDNKPETFYLYGKTGTSNIDNIDYRRLVIIISDKKLHDENNKQTIEQTLELAKNVKFYTLYITYNPSGTEFKNLSSKVISQVVKSEVFKNYMNSK